MSVNTSIHTGAFTKQHTLIIKVKDNMRGAKKQKYVFEQMATGFMTNTVTVSIFFFQFRADF